ncbi:MAG: aminotransferase class III-fold pyridoxal phosphate-dependent enzyme [Verrucomicrobia bacterium]|nr:aminotransferase class III-fold pyridoxal phosphate-dependent enzyme [Verrucomicrobiota bacterium]
MSVKCPTLPPYSHQPRPYQGPSTDEVLRLRKEFLTPSLFAYYQKPLMIVEGSMQYLFDEKGRRYLDGFAGIVTVSVGHCHPEVIAAVDEQNHLLQHTSTIYLHPGVALYGQELAATLPGDLKVCYFVNSGSEANDLALMLARAYTGNYNVIALRNSYHGGSLTSMGLTSHHTWKYNIPHGFGIQFAKAPYPYRGPWSASEPNAGKNYAADVEELIRFATPGKIAAFVAESVQGVGGAVVFPDGYLAEAYRHVRAAGGLCIADEVQAGFGRTGKAFWGFQTQGVQPDIVVMAKGIGNGCPLAAVVTTPKIAETLAQRIHFNTYGGNPVSVAQGRATLKIIRRDNLQQRCAVLGERLMIGLRKLQEQYECIGEVRGLGLMIGVEAVKNRQTKEPDRETIAEVLEQARERGLLIGKGGLFGNVLRIKPPMCLSEADVDFMLAVLAESFAAATKR